MLGKRPWVYSKTPATEEKVQCDRVRNKINLVDARLDGRQGIGKTGRDKATKWLT